MFQEDKLQCVCVAVGSCQSEVNGEGRSFNAGNANAKLEYERDGVLLLNYSGGDVCHHNNVSRSTIISFICQQEAGHGQPVFVASSDSCAYYFDWHTDLVCEQTVSLPHGILKSMAYDVPSYRPCVLTPFCLQHM